MAPKPPSTNPNNPQQFKLGDLVRVSDNALKYFAGKLAIVVSQQIKEYEFEIDTDNFFRVMLVEEAVSHVFAAHELVLLSSVPSRLPSGSLSEPSGS
tara:strand:- start:3022 stop:3312 length:291 start_codon:yes stop_codon:yes gene_type:complete